MLLDLDSLDWDDELLDVFGVDRALLPRLVSSSEVVGRGGTARRQLPIAGIAGDQQAALFGHGCFERGEAKATYGTGSFVLANAGAERGPARPASSRRSRRPAATHSRARSSRAAPRSSGCATVWGILADAAESERLARTVESTGGVTFVPRSPASARRTGTRMRAG